MHYSQPRKMELAIKHYLYTVEIPELTTDNHLVSAQPVAESIVARVEEKLDMIVPADKKSAGKEFRKWLGTTLTGAKKAEVEEERRAAEFLDGIGVIYNVWPQAQSKPDGLKNIAVFNADHVNILKREEIEIELKCKKWILKERKEL